MKFAKQDTAQDIKGIQEQWDRVWLDSKGVTQGKWTKGMLDIKQWIMNRIKQFMTTHETSKIHMTLWDMTHKTTKNHMTLWDMIC